MKRLRMLICCYVIIALSNANAQAQRKNIAPPEWLVRAAVTDIRKDARGNAVSEQRITHVYDGPQDLSGQVFRMSAPADISGLGLYAFPSRTGVEGIWMLRKNGDTFLPVTRSYDILFPAIEEVSPRYPQVRQMAEALKRVATTPPGKQSQLLLDLASSQVPEVSSMAAKMLVRNKPVAIEGLEVEKIFSKEDLGRLPEGLLTNNKHAQNRAIIQVAAERQSITEAVYRILGEEASDANRNRIASGIRLAGVMRLDLPAIITRIVNKIDFLEYGRIIGTHPFDFRTDYIAVDALIQIGKPAIAPTIKRLSVETEPMIRSMLVRVIEDIEGKEMGTIILNKEIQQAKDLKKQNLQDALKLLNSGE